PEDGVVTGLSSDPALVFVRYRSQHPGAAGQATPVSRLARLAPEPNPDPDAALRAGLAGWGGGGVIATTNLPWRPGEHDRISPCAEHDQLVRRLNPDAAWDFCAYECDECAAEVRG